MNCDIPPWSEVETAYIAGIVDGEGSIGIYRRHIATVAIVTTISVSNTNLDLIKWLCTMFGLLPEQHAIISHSGWRQWYSVRATGTRAFLIVLRIQPYLKVKAKQAELLVRYREKRQEIGHRFGNHPLSQNEVESIMEFVNGIKVLNRRGSQP